MNAYYLIDATLLEQARQFAPTVGLPNQLFQYVVSLDGSKAIVQAEWGEDALAWLNEHSIFLGELQPDGSAPQAVYEELAKPEWQSPMEEY